MGRKSSLTPEQWIEVDRRIVVDGESVYALAKEFGVNESSIRRKIKPNKADKAERAEKHHPELREIAQKKVEAVAVMKRVDAEIEALPYAHQQIVSTFQQKITNVGNQLLSAAEYSSATAHRLSAIANAQVQRIDDSGPLSTDSMESLKSVAIFTKMANDASVIGVNLINANKESVKIINNAPPALARTINPAKLSDAALKELMLARA